MECFACVAIIEADMATPARRSTNAAQPAVNKTEIFTLCRLSVMGDPGLGVQRGRMSMRTIANLIIKLKQCDLFSSYPPLVLPLPPSLPPLAPGKKRSETCNPPVGGAGRPEAIAAQFATFLVAARAYFIKAMGTFYP
ncbi:hypothetical protein [uncultured Rhodoferax sp.]|uniref:hypothetical protein n=1 Tax=uncultured Rhodoferax sp. TaxID=223188 RepID=UPI0025D0456B|nr:hypothetical protein [uncultured Rhodoferax sp.]